MSEPIKLEGVYDLACRLTAQFRAYDLLNNVACFHRDCGVQYEDIREHAQETLRGIHDTLREFEAECRKDQAVISEIFRREGRPCSKEINDLANERVNQFVSR